MAELRIEVVREVEGVRVVLVGEADAFACPGLEAEMGRVAGENPKRVVVDLTGVTFVSSAGMGVFLKLQAAIGKAGGRVFLGGASPAIEESFRRARLDRVLKFIALPSAAD